MNRLLVRQMRRLGIDPDSGCADQAQWMALLERVSGAYDDADRSRYLLERSLRISSQEMAKLNEEARERSEAEVARSEQRFSNLLTSSVIPTWLLDFSQIGEALAALRVGGVDRLDEHFEQFPDDMERMVGLAILVGLNSTAIEMMDPAPVDIPATLAELSPIMEAARQATIGLMHAIWKGRDEVRIEVRGEGEMTAETEFYGILHANIPRIDGERDLANVIVVVTDVTAVKQAEERMERLVKSKDEFLAAVSHEIRTPLTSVFGSALLLQEQGELLTPDETQEMIGRIARESGEVTDLVEDLLVAARADAGSIRVDRTPFAVLPEVERVIADLADRPPHVDYTEVHGLALGDPLRFKQIVRNLVTNAVRYGGPQILLASAEADGVLTLSVCDNGNAIDENRHETIFDLYERESGGSTVTNSVGVGLTVSRQLARLMGGDVTYDHSGGWSRFKLSLPAVSASAGEMTEAPLRPRV